VVDRPVAIHGLIDGSVVKKKQEGSEAAFDALATYRPTGLDTAK